MSTHQPARPEHVLIDGIRYVRVTDASPAVAALEDAIVGQYWGANWRASQPDAVNYVQVVITDSVADDEGESVTEFIARILAAMESQP